MCLRNCRELGRVSNGVSGSSGRANREGKDRPAKLPCFACNPAIFLRPRDANAKGKGLGWFENQPRGTVPAESSARESRLISRVDGEGRECKDAIRKEYCRIRVHGNEKFRLESSG